ncbi:MAG: NUDIX hydrolase [Chloroflexi bacterium]|nr:NUDIX hydrolase [Chloroflexota bacterium]
MNNHPATTPITASRRYPAAPLVGVGVVVFNGQGHVLLVKRGRPPRAGQWSIPGGLIDVGEPLAAAARREVREECAIEIELFEMVAIFEPIERDTEQRVEYHYVIIDYWAKYVSGEAVAQDDAADLAWVDVNALAPLKLRRDTENVILKAHQAWQSAQ